MNTASRLILPRATRSRRSINSLWCAAGSYPQYRHHSIRLLRTRRRFNSSSAAMAGEMSGLQSPDSVVDRPCPILGFVILRCSDNAHQHFVTYVIRVLAGLLFGGLSRPACSGILKVLRDFNESALCGDVAFRGACDLAADHGLQSRHSRDLVALADGERTIEFLPDERLGTLSFGVLPFSGWIAGLPFAETAEHARFAVRDRTAVLRQHSLFLGAHRITRLRPSAAGPSAAA